MKLLTGYGVVLGYFYAHPTATGRQAAKDTGMTERMILRLRIDLERAGLLERVPGNDRRQKYTRLDAATAQRCAALAGGRRRG